MSWTPHLIMTCKPDPAAAQVTPPCAEGYTATTVQAYLPSTDPSTLTLEDMELGGYFFALVFMVFVLSSGLGMLIKIFRSQ